MARCAIHRRHRCCNTRAHLRPGSERCKRRNRTACWDCWDWNDLFLLRPGLDIEQQFRREVFNILVRNQNGHAKNIAFLMSWKGKWHLSLAFDIVHRRNKWDSGMNL